MSKPTLYEMKRACLSGKDIQRLLQGQNVWVGHTSFVYDGTEVKEIEEGMKSAFSYGGASDLVSFRENVTWREISSGGQRESKA